MSAAGGAAPAPDAAEWLCTRGCNLRCRHCAIEGGRRAPDELDTAEALAMMDALAGLGVRRFSISGGEPTTRPDWERLLDHALGRFESVMLTTNGFGGARLAERLEARPGRARLHVSLSLDGPEAVHDARRARGSHRRLLEALAGLASVETEVITTVGRDNVEHLDAVLELCLAQGVPVWTIQPGVPLGRLSSERSLGRAGISRIAEWARRTQARVPDRLRIHTTDLVSAEQGCGCGNERLVVRPDGQVAACVFLVESAYGNVRDGGLESIWRSEPMEAFRRRAARACVAAGRVLPGGQYSSA